MARKEAAAVDGIKKVIVGLPEDLYNEVKLTAIGQGQTVSEFVVALVQREAPALRQRLIERLSVGGKVTEEATTV